jgi:glycosyltransferase involved in cell wall biosynthesis
VNLIEGDVILASKPRVTSYGIALLKSLKDDIPVILDIDDWETGFKFSDGKVKTLLKDIPRLINTGSFYYTRTLESLSGLADARTVSNRFLQSKFGGEIIPHARDTAVFAPDRFDKQAVRQEFNLPLCDDVIMFSGTPRPHKGVDHLVKAVSQMDRGNTKVVIVGAHESEYVDELQQLGGDKLILRGQQPFSEIPKWIAAADVIAIPQKDSPATKGQVPAKVFDAMAMGKPIVATQVSDLPEILDGCGVLVPSESVTDLRDAIECLLADEEQRNALGKRAREKCIEQYSYDAITPHLADIVELVR